MKKILSITGKELKLYFGSPMALIFVGVFLVLTLFVFFWVDSFFARGVADVRALFEWMPLLMILLVSALTMHQWSREEESGNLQVLLTMPVRLIELAAGKFLSALTLVALALGLTLFLPLTVQSLGNLDWGPVIGGYLAALLLASSYIAIGSIRFLADRQPVGGADRDGIHLRAAAGDWVAGRHRLVRRGGGRSAAAVWHGQSLREHRARRHRPARSGLLSVARALFPGAQHPVAG